MSQITGGTYGRTVNIGDYNSKKAEIAFSVDEGENPEIAAQQAVSLCHKILFTISAGAASRSDTRSEPVNQGSQETAPAETPGKKKPGRPPKTAVNLDPTDHRAAANGPSDTVKDVTADSAAVIDESPTEQEAGASADAGAVVADPADISDDDLYALALPEVTDVDITKAVTKANTSAESLAAIRKLIGEFVAPPKRLTDIPQGERHRFLEKLATLAKVA